MKPVLLKEVEALARRNFEDGDVDRDGMVTAEEVRGAVQARKDAAILERFSRVDTDGDRSIAEAEFVAWQRSLGSAVLAEGANLVARFDLIPETIPLVFKDEGNALVLSRLVEPLSVTLVTSANANYDAGVSSEELLAYHRRKFAALDLDANGALDREELRALIPEMDELPPDRGGEGRSGEKKGKGGGKGRGRT